MTKAPVTDVSGVSIDLAAVGTKSADGVGIDAALTAAQTAVAVRRLSFGTAALVTDVLSLVEPIG